MEAEQLDLFSPNPPPERIVLAVETKIGVFGNRTDLIVVDGSTVRGTALVECEDSDVRYYNAQSEDLVRGLR